MSLILTLSKRVVRTLIHKETLVLHSILEWHPSIVVINAPNLLPVGLLDVVSKCRFFAPTRFAASLMRWTTIAITTAPNRVFHFPIFIHPSLGSWDLLILSQTDNITHGSKKEFLAMVHWKWLKNYSKINKIVSSFYNDI